MWAVCLWRECDERVLHAYMECSQLFLGGSQAASLRGWGRDSDSVAGGRVPQGGEASGAEVAAWARAQTDFPASLPSLPPWKHLVSIASDSIISHRKTCMELRTECGTQIANQCRMN